MNLTHLSKIIERAMLDQLVPFLEEVGLVPRYQSAYRKLHSTETAFATKFPGVRPADHVQFGLNHKIDLDHRIDWDGAKIVFKSNSYFKRRIVESTLIATYPCFNLSDGHFKLNKAFKTQIVNSLPPSAVR